MDLGLSQVPAIIAASTTSYMAEFSGLFYLVGGIVLAVGVIGALVEILTGRKTEPYLEE